MDKAAKPIRILVVDDSAFNRQTITAMLEGIPGFQVVGRAGDGEEGLKMAFQLAPDVITLDLEMPKMDGFAFLRLLMARQPTPVIVISGYATRENVFKALELGALDFVAKPSRTITPELRNIQEELQQKVRLVTQLRMVSLADRAARTRSTGTMSGQFLPPPAPVQPPASRKEGLAPSRLIAIGASTGGPPAINRILVNLEPTLPAGIVITQHMPAKFTRAFAERLDRTTPWHVREAEPGDAVSAGCVLVAPGSGSLVLRRRRPWAPTSWPSCSPAWAATVGAASRRSRRRAGAPWPRRRRRRSSSACRRRRSPPAPSTTWCRCPTSPSASSASRRRSNARVTRTA
jgi:two-component system, chemotaxis family, protein-glutamate methylesterase/glutaminase